MTAATIAVTTRRFAQSQALSREVVELRQTLEDRKLIERAKGVVMNRLHVDGSDAYRRLRRMSSVRKIRLVDVAQEVLTTEAVFEALEQS